MSAVKAFEQHAKQNPVPNIGHEEDCYYYKMTGIAPINECTCSCYEKAFFRAGYLAAKGVKDERR